MEQIDAVTALGNLLARHHEGSPVFDRHSNEFYSGLPEAYRAAMRVLRESVEERPVPLR